MSELVNFSYAGLYADFRDGISRAEGRREVASFWLPKVVAVHLNSGELSVRTKVCGLVRRPALSMITRSPGLLTFCHFACHG